MLNRRNTFIVITGAGLAACTNGNIDPVKIDALLKQACGIAVPLATIVEILHLDPTMSASAIVNLLCSGYTAQVAASKPALKAGSSVEYDVVVNGKTVHVIATRS